MDVKALDINKQYYRLEKSETGIDIYYYYYTNNRRYKRMLFWTRDTNEDALAELSDIKAQIQKQIL